MTATTLRVTALQSDNFQQRLRWNRGRARRAELARRIARLWGELIGVDLVGPSATAQLAEAALAYVSTNGPSRTWPDAERPSVLSFVADLGRGMRDHTSCLVLLGDPEQSGAMRVTTADACSHVDAIWGVGSEPFCLVGDDLEDGLYLDYTDPDQMRGGHGYEVWLWGGFDAA